MKVVDVRYWGRESQGRDCYREVVRVHDIDEDEGKEVGEATDITTTVRNIPFTINKT
jgi:hypothetical protein